MLRWITARDKGLCLIRKTWSKVKPSYQICRDRIFIWMSLAGCFSRISFKAQDLACFQGSFYQWYITPLPLQEDHWSWSFLLPSCGHRFWFTVNWGILYVLDGFSIYYIASNDRGDLDLLIQESFHILYILFLDYISEQVLDSSI